jgi:hypothetical protein
MSEPAEVEPLMSGVCADDVAVALRLAVAALRDAPDSAWEHQAGDLTWNCWETVEHLCDDLFFYAVQLGPQPPPLDREVPFLWETLRSGGPENAVRADRAAGPTGLLQVLEASGALLVAMVRTTPPEVRAYHTYGVSDPEGFAAMGIVEILVHMHDLGQGLGLAWRPPEDLCSRVLARLFPDAPTDADAWSVLLWSTGRLTLPGQPQLTKWRWDGRPRPRRPQDAPQ